jgi:ribosomal protein S18 acetylase RimI-like enzyme
MQTRPARPEDIEFLAEVFLSSMRESIALARGYWDPAKEHEQFRKQLELQNTLVIQVDGLDVGFVTVRQESDKIVVNTLCVSEAHQGRGIGSAIMRGIMTRAEAAASPVELFVLKVNVRARALYERLGFVVEAELAHHVRMRCAAAD